MNVRNIKEIAKAKGVKVGNMKKENIIKSIQRAEGNFDCFGTALLRECSQVDCLWRTDCIG